MKPHWSSSSGRPRAKRWYRFTWSRSILTRTTVRCWRTSEVASRTLRERLVAASDRSLFLILGQGDTTREIEFPANQPVPPVRVELDLSGGNVANYPFGTYRADLSVQFFADAVPPATEAKALPAEVGVWEAVLGFQLETAEQPAATRARFGCTSIFIAAAASRYLRSPPTAQWWCSAARR